MDHRRVIFTLFNAIEIIKLVKAPLAGPFIRFVPFLPIQPVVGFYTESDLCLTGKTQNHNRNCKTQFFFSDKIVFICHVKFAHKVKVLARKVLNKGFYFSFSYLKRASLLNQSGQSHNQSPVTSVGFREFSQQ